MPSPSELSRPDPDRTGPSSQGPDSGSEDLGASPDLRARAALVRHGETAWSLSLRHTGRTDIPLDTEGEAEAHRLASLLGRWTFTRVLVSPLGRAMQTCQLAGFGEEAEVVPDLVEWDYGDYEGRTTAEIRQERPGWRLWVDGPAGGETLTELAVRADRVIGDIRAGGGEVAVFSHGHFLRVLAARWVGLGAESGSLLALDAGALSELGWEHENAVVQLWNLT